jgi:PAS domain S-box-containing protein
METASDLCNKVLLFEKMDDPLVISNNGRFIGCNQAAAKFLGYTSKEGLINQTVIDISPVMQPDGQRSADRIKANIEAVQKNGSHRVEWVFLRADGSEVPVEIMMTAMTFNGQHNIYSVWRHLS